MAEVVYPYKKYNYSVTIDNEEVGGFSEVSATDITVDPIEYREGIHARNTVIKLPGLVKYSNVTLKWGMTTSGKLYEWFKEVEGGKITRKTIVITLKGDNSDEAELAKWTLINAWPTKYSATDLNATSNEVAVESMEFVTEGITRDK